MSLQNPITAQVSTPVTYKGGQKLTPNGSSTAATLPTGTNMVYVYAEGGKIYWEINPSGDASADSPGYCPDGNMRVIGPLTSLTSLKVFGTGATVYAHLEYFDGL